MKIKILIISLLILLLIACSEKSNMKVNSQNSTNDIQNNIEAEEEILQCFSI